MGERWGCRKKPHFVLCAALGRGHMIPMVGLARALAFTGEVSVTIIFQNAGARDSIQGSVIFSGLDVEVTVLDETNHCEDPPWLTRGSVWARMEKNGSRRPSLDPGNSSRIPGFPQESALRELLGKIISSPSPPVCLVADFSLPWTASPARDLDLPRYVLYTDAASFMAVACSCKKVVEMGMLPAKDPHAKNIVVTGVPNLSQNDISRFIWDSSDEYFPRVDLWHQKTLASDGVLLNTFYELEASAIDALREEILPGKTSLFTVGPLISTVGEGNAVYAGDRDDSIHWLNSKPDCSVLYVSFGSWEVLVDEQIMELARALEASGCFFLWVVRLSPGASIDGLLPQGFKSRVVDSGRGKIVTTWVPQQEILMHRATGGFMTHCGWNSVLECVSLAGVPMVCWPFLSDQPTTCRFVVDGLRVGVEVCEDENGFVNSDEIENAVRKVMREGDEMRNAARDFKRLAAKATLSEQGSSRVGLTRFVAHAMETKQRLLPRSKDII